MGDDARERLPSCAELIRTLPLASAVLDREMRYLAYNQRWLDAYRLGDTPLEGRSHYEVFPEIGDEWKALHQRCLHGAEISRVADPFPRVDGTVDYVDYTVTPWREADGTVGGIVMHTEVVTEREVLSRRLREEEAFVKDLFERSPVGFNLSTLDGLWLESNPAVLAIIGYSAAEADGGLTYWQLTPDEYVDQERAQLEALQRTGRCGPFETEFIRKDGSRVPVRLTCFIIERGGERYMWSLIEDMTAQRVLEEKLERERLRSLQAAKLASIGEMAAGIAHEINNPLQVIESHAFELALAVEAGSVPSIEGVHAIQRAVDRAGRIVRGLRKFAREESGKLERCDVPELVEETLALTATRIRNYGVSLEVNLASQAQIRCDALEMTQVLVNLLNNAFDAVRTNRGTIWFDVQDEGGEVTFRVSDSGPGVPEGIGARVFEPFVTTKAAGEGTGLGLSISRSMVEAMGGSLRYERCDGRSVFTVTLPIRSEP